MPVQGEHPGGAGDGNRDYGGPGKLGEAVAGAADGGRGNGLDAGLTTLRGGVEVAGALEDGDQRLCRGADGGAVDVGTGRDGRGVDGTGDRGSEEYLVEVLRVGIAGSERGEPERALN